MFLYTIYFDFSFNQFRWESTEFYRGFFAQDSRNYWSQWSLLFQDWWIKLDKHIDWSFHCWIWYYSRHTGFVFIKTEFDFDIVSFSLKLEKRGLHWFWELGNIGFLEWVDFQVWKFLYLQKLAHEDFKMNRTIFPHIRSKQVLSS